MKKSTKISTAIISFFLIIILVVVGRTMIGNHFKKKFSKRPPPGIIVKEVVYKSFSENIESFGTAVSKRAESFRIKRDNLTSELILKDYVKKGDLIVALKDRNIIAPFDGILGYRGITGDILGSETLPSNLSLLLASITLNLFVLIFSSICSLSFTNSFFSFTI